MNRSRAIATVFAFAFFAAPVLAWQVEPETAPSKQEEKARAREERIQEYLRKKEERRARREMADAQKRAASETAPAPGAAAAAAATEPTAGKPTREARRQRTRRPSIPRHIERIHEDLRRSNFGQDPTVEDYLVLIESGEATPHQLAAFGSFLGEAGLIQSGIAYYGLALGMDDRDPLLWTNVGTLHRKAGEFGQAVAAYSNALGLDRTNAFAHYNLGTVFDEMGDYDDAIAEYKIALTLDPSLGDPATNPQAANNNRLLAVRLMLYKEQAGADSLPLLQLPGGDLDAESQDD